MAAKKNKEAKEKEVVPEVVAALPPKRKLSTRVTLQIVPIWLFLGVLFAASAIMLDRMYVKKITDDKANMVADVFMAAATDSIITKDEDVLVVLATQALEREKRLKWISFTDENDKVLVERGTKSFDDHLLMRERELKVGNEKFGSLVVEIDFGDLAEELKIHDLILGGSMMITFLLLLPFVKAYAKKYAEVPLAKIQHRLNSVLEGRNAEGHALVGLPELLVMEDLFQKIKHTKEAAVPSVSPPDVPGGAASVSSPPIVEVPATKPEPPVAEAKGQSASVAEDGATAETKSAEYIETGPPKPKNNSVPDEPTPVEPVVDKDDLAAPSPTKTEVVAENPVAPDTAASATEVSGASESGVAGEKAVAKDEVPPTAPEIVASEAAPAEPAPTAAEQAPASSDVTQPSKTPENVAASEESMAKNPETPESPPDVVVTPTEPAPAESVPVAAEPTPVTQEVTQPSKAPENVVASEESVPKEPEIADNDKIVKEEVVAPLPEEATAGGPGKDEKA